MKKQTLLAGLLAAALAVSLAACTDSSPESSATPETTPTPTPTATPTPEPTPTPVSAAPIWGDQSFSRTFTAGDGTLVMTVSYTLPLVQNTDSCLAGTAINAWYQEEASGRLSEAEDRYEMAVSDYDVSKATGLPFTPTTEEMTYQVSYESETVISVCREWYLSGGSPYPTVFRLAERFDAQTGEKLSFAHFFTDADAVRDQVVAAFLAQEEIIAGGFTADQITVAYQPEYFYLTESGYTFWIQGNTLTGVHEPVEVTLSFDALKDVSADGAL